MNPDISTDERLRELVEMATWDENPEFHALPDERGSAEEKAWIAKCDRKLVALGRLQNPTIAQALLRARRNALDTPCGHDHQGIPCHSYDGCKEFCPRCATLADTELEEAL